MSSKLDIYMAKLGVKPVISVSLGRAQSNCSPEKERILTPYTIFWPRGVTY